jgi:ferredoxin-NADP reductase
LINFRPLPRKGSIRAYSGAVVFPYGNKKSSQLAFRENLRRLKQKENVESVEQKNSL